MKNATKLALLSGAALTVMGCTTVAQTGYPPPVGYPAPAQGAYGSGYSNDYSQLVLFDGRDYNGISRVLDGGEPNLNFLEFNDRAASLDIRGGGFGWLVCKDANFEGPCLVARETIDNLDAYGMGDKVSSARPLDPRNPYPHGTIFGINYFGDMVFYESDLFGNLSEMDPYDAWGYSAYDYGYVDTYQTGRYGDYGRYGRYNPYNPYSDYNYDGRNWSGYRGPTNADIVLYRDRDFAGSAYGLNRSAWDLSTLYFNDEVSSIEVRSGRWEICTDSNFGGRCQIIDASVNSLNTLYLNDTISSVRRVGRGEGGGRRDGGYGRGRDGGYGDRDRGRGDGGRRGGNRDNDIVVYEHGNYQGRSVGIGTDIANVNTLGMNDRISSIEIRSGIWEVCSDPNYQGRCQTIDASTTNLNLLRMNDSISSLRRVSGGGQRPGNGGRDRGNDQGRGDQDRGRDGGWNGDRDGNRDGSRDRDGDRDRDGNRDRNRDRDGSRNGNPDRGQGNGGQRPNPSPPPPPPPAPPPTRNDDLLGGPRANDRSLPPGIRAVRREQTRDANSIGRLSTEEMQALERGRRDAERRQAAQAERERANRARREADDRQSRNAEMERRRADAERMREQQVQREQLTQERAARPQRQAPQPQPQRRAAPSPPPPPPVASPPPPPPPPPVARPERPRESKQQRLIRQQQEDR